MSYYFDTSSLVKIYHKEDGSQKVLEIYKSQDVIHISELSNIEFISTIYRKYRENEINIDALNALIEKFQDDIGNRYQVLRFSSLVFDEAWGLICNFGEQYSLRTLDSLQFAFFKSYCEKDNIFVCSDKRLIKLVELEGFIVLSP